MTYKVWVGVANAAYNVTLYSRAGDTVTSGEEYNLEYSTDNVTWTYVAGPLSSTSCTQHSTVSTSTGVIYVRAVRDSDTFLLYGRGSNSSTCPANLDIICEYPATITGNEDVAYTVYVTAGDFVPCAV